MKKIISVVSALMFCASVSFAATGLDYNQPLTYSFNHTAAVTKTTTYTILAADSLVNCDATSASFAVTLPSIDSLIAAGYGKKGYKIVKTDSSVNTVTVTPATGDTIGGESTRLLINDDAYMVITAEANGNWKVNYETPYVVEDHEAGTVDINTYALDASLIFEGATADAFETTVTVTDPTADNTVTLPNVSGTVAMTAGLGSVKTVTAGSGTTTVATTDCGKVFTAAADANGVFNLFNIATANKGCEITFINVGADTNNLLTINPDDSDTIDCISLSNAAAAVDIEGSAGDAISNTKATAEQGDNLTLVSDGTSGWYCKGHAAGIWADIN